MRIFLSSFIVLCIVAFLPPPVPAGETETVRALVAAWRDAWERKDSEAYLSFYSPEYRSQGMNFPEWAAQRREILSREGALSIEIQGLSVIVEADRAAVQFVQRFRGPVLDDVGEKLLELEKTSGRWQIVDERWRPLSRPVLFSEKTDGSIDPANSPASEKGRLPLPPSSDSGAATVQGPMEGAAENPSAGTAETLVPVSPVAADVGLTHRIVDGWERVCLRLPEAFLPVVFPLEGSRPRLVMDVPEVETWNGSATTIVDGPLVRTIRTFLHKDERRLRIVLDLNPAENYTVSEVADPKGHVHCLQVK